MTIPASVYCIWNVAILVACAWLMSRRNQARAWIVLLSPLLAGVIWNIAALRWLGYDKVATSEQLVMVGITIVLGGLIFLRRPLVTR
ncbi:hypothetical protein AWB76_03920 [Caballeronia temeraria]|uniref:Uncharacterized protein n=1 Tax=Caballeronia temeraria TaxID=1777137 RepID=A0A158BBB8_9BURK|nr:hypothetical protein [Caballeronia temeraria]SAK67066.1 hypothetical protein AWB76_03920 [Caballeronia temeraria]